MLIFSLTFNVFLKLVCNGILRCSQRVHLSQHINDHVNFNFEEGKSETTILQLGSFSMTAANSVTTESWEAGFITRIPRGKN